MKIGIVGDGKLGTDIFNYLSCFELALTWVGKDSMEDKRNQFKKKLDRKLKNVLIDPAFYEYRSKHTNFSTSLEVLVDCEVVLECIWEDLDAKRVLINELDSILAKETIIASNSSSIIPSSLSDQVDMMTRIIGLHFFYPVALKNIVEVIFSKNTSDKTKRITAELVEKIDRQALYLDEQNAFILNRFLLMIQATAFNLVQEHNIDFQNMDVLVKEHLFPMGIFETIDHVGIDVILPSVRNYTASIDSDTMQFYKPLIQSLEKFIEKKQFGIKTGKGFYNYENADKENFNESKELLYIEPSLKEKIIVQLKNSFLESFNQIINSSFENKELLNSMIKEYLDVQKGPLEMTKELT